MTANNPSLCTRHCFSDWCIDAWATIETFGRRKCISMPGTATKALVTSHLLLLVACEPDAQATTGSIRDVTTNPTIVIWSQSQTRWYLHVSLFSVSQCLYNQVFMRLFTCKLYYNFQRQALVNIVEFITRWDSGEFIVQQDIHNAQNLHFSNINISQGSVATRLRGCGRFTELQ